MASRLLNAAAGLLCALSPREHDRNDESDETGEVRWQVVYLGVTPVASSAGHITLLYSSRHDFTADEWEMHPVERYRSGPGVVTLAVPLGYRVPSLLEAAGTCCSGRLTRSGLGARESSCELIAGSLYLRRVER